jgi:phosphoserine phosphatase
MNERELKDKLDSLRTQANKKKKEINEILSEVRIHQKEVVNLRKIRDEGNEKCKKLSHEARQLREKRDKLNVKISSLKDKRKKLNEKIKTKSGAIKDSKEKRDKLNRSARGTDTSLSSKFDSSLVELLQKDISLEKEIKLFNSIFKLMERLEAAKEATEFHKKVVSTYEEIKGLDEKADTLSSEIRQLADGSEEYHLKALEIYKKVDETRKEADESHKKLLEKYETLNPLRDRLTSLRVELEKIQEDMSPYAEEMDKIRAKREEEKKAIRATEAKEKLKSSKRISFEDFRAIIEDDGTSPANESGA